MTPSPFPYDVAQRYPVPGGWADRTFAELDAAVSQVCAALLGHGVAPGDRVALLARTRPEWTVCDLAITRLGAVCVPVYPTSTPAQAAWVLQDSGAVAVIVETVEHLDVLAALRPELPALRTVRALDVATPDGAAMVDVIAGDGEVDVPTHVAAPDDPFTIVYTSGTTGNPKGCVLSHRNVAWVVEVMREIADVGRGDVVFAYLPLAHLLTRVLQLYCLDTGATIAYASGDIRKVVAEVAEVAPTHLPSVPTLFEKVYAVVTSQLGGVSPADAGEEVHAMVRAAFGGRLRAALTGAAPIAPEIIEFFFACGVPVYEAYGLTESTAVISANVPGAWRVGTVGRAVPGTELRIADDGEVCARSVGVFAGYWDDPAASDQAVVDGWLRTGDLGALDAEGARDDREPADALGW